MKPGVNSSNTRLKGATFFSSSESKHNCHPNMKGILTIMKSIGCFCIKVLMSYLIDIHVFIPITDILLLLDFYLISSSKFWV